MEQTGPVLRFDWRKMGLWTRGVVARIVNDDGQPSGLGGGGPRQVFTYNPPSSQRSGILAERSDEQSRSSGTINTHT